jgi:broad specificity phosphatase PhoE
VQRLRDGDGNALVFSSGHFLRVLAARWLGEEASAGRHFVLGTAALCVLGYDHDRTEPVIRLWNQLPQPAP